MMADIPRCGLCVRQAIRQTVAAFNISGRPQRAAIGTFQIPKVSNQPNQHYGPRTPERKSLVEALAKYKETPARISAVIGGEPVSSDPSQQQLNPSRHAETVAYYADTPKEQVSQAIDLALQAKPAWESMPFADRASIFLKAADLISGPYRHRIIAATMLGQGKNAWQAEIDAAAELADFLRFNVQYAQELYADQPVHNSKGVWNRMEYRPLEGFIYAISPFNFTAIGGNLPGAPALMGNVVLWKPSPYAMASNQLIHKILLECGLPPNVIQFVPGDAEDVTSVALSHPQFAGLHYTGSTAVFRSLYGKIGQGIADSIYRGYPRVVGETGGKNFHLIHKSADLSNAVLQTVRGAFEYAGQKCSATSRVYVPKSLYGRFSTMLQEQVERLKVGPPEAFENFVGPVIHQHSFAKLKKVIDEARGDKGLRLIAGGTYDDGEGYFIRPTVYAAMDPRHPLFSTELFGPIIVVHPYSDSSPSAFEDVCALVDGSSSYALTGSVFAQDRAVIRQAEDLLRNAAGNFYINCKSTGAVVGQQPFGGARASGTNDKAGSASLLSRFTSMRAIKEEFEPITKVEYVSNDI